MVMIRVRLTLITQEFNSDFIRFINLWLYLTQELKTTLAHALAKRYGRFPLFSVVGTLRVLPSIDYCL